MSNGESVIAYLNTQYKGKIEYFLDLDEKVYFLDVEEEDIEYLNQDIEDEEISNVVKITLGKVLEKAGKIQKGESFKIEQNWWDYPNVNTFH